MTDMKEKAKARLRELTKDHMIFDLIDLFDQKQFRLIESNHCLSTD